MAEDNYEPQDINTFLPGQFTGIGMYDEGGKFEVKQEFIDAARAKAIEEGKKYYGDATNFEVFRDGILNLPDSAINFVARGAEGTGELFAGLASLVMKGGQLATTTDPDKLTQIMSEPSFTKYMGAFRNKIPTPNLYESNISGMEDAEKAFGTAGYYAAPVPVVPIAKGAGQVVKGLASTNIGKNIADELGTAATYFPQYTPFKKIEPKSVGAKSVDESGNVKTTMGPAPKNLKPAADKWLQDNPGEPNATAMDVFLNEPDKYLKTGIVNIGNIKDRRIALGISTPEGKNINKLSAKRKENTFTDFKSNLENVDMNDPQAVLNAFRSSYKKGYAETEAAKQYEKTGSLAKSESANSQINELIDQFENTEGGFKILKQKEINKLKPKKKDTSDIYAEYYRKEFSPNTAVINVKKSSEFRFFNNKRRTLDDQTPQEFFSEYSLKDIEKGGKFHNEYLQFKAIDDVRIKNVENLQPILRKIFTKVRESIPNLRPNKKKSLVNLNIAHKFESSGIKRGYVSETKTGKGTDPTEIYIDVSEYNQTIQPSLEAEARKLYKKYIESGDEAARKEYLKIDKDMKILGIEGQVAPGQTVGKAMPFDDKIRQIADEAIDNNFITQKEYDQLINSAEEIAESKIKFFDTFGIKTTYAGGGIVGIDRMTRSLREF